MACSVLWCWQVCCDSLEPSIPLISPETGMNKPQGGLALRCSSDRTLLLGERAFIACVSGSLTCCDSLAAAAASPVSMEATLVPSRTGLSWRGTEGPTRATRQADAGQMQKVSL